MQDNLEKFMLSKALTRGGRYVSTLGSSARPTSTSQAHQQHLRFWASFMKCKEFHIGISDDYYSDEAARVYSFVGGYKITRAFSSGRNNSFKLLSVDREKFSFSKIGESDWMKFCPKLNSEWEGFEYGFNYKSRETTVQIDGETANVMSATYDVWNFPTLTWEENIVYGRDDPKRTSSACLFRRYRIG
jgi:hypothetical protein